MNLIAKLVLSMAACVVLASSIGAQELTGTLKTIRASGVVKIGYRDSSMPFSYVDDRKKPMGYAVDLCLKVVDAIKEEFKSGNVRIEFVPVDSATRVSAVTSGKIDMECGSTTNSVERQKLVAFSPTYFLTGTRIIVLRRSGITGHDDLKGKTVVVTTGTTSEAAIREYNENWRLGMTFIASNSHAESFLAVETGRADAFPMDDILLYSLKVNAKIPNDFEVVGDFLTDDPYGIMIRRDDPSFKKLVDNAIRRVYKSGEINKIYTRWFQLPTPPNGVNLGVPMSEALRRLIRNPDDKGVESCDKMSC